MRQQERRPASRTWGNYEELSRLTFRGRDQVGTFTVLFIFCFTVSDSMPPTERILVLSSTCLFIFLSNISLCILSLCGSLFIYLFQMFKFRWIRPLLYLFTHGQESVALFGNTNNPHTNLFFHSRIIMPFVKTCLMVLPSVQTIWKSVTDVVIAPLCTSVGRSFSSVSLQLSHDWNLDPRSGDLDTVILLCCYNVKALLFCSKCSQLF